MTERRCPDCDKLVAVESIDFVGDVLLFCRRSKTTFGSETPVLPRLNCPRGSWLASGVVIVGSIRMVCQRCSMIVLFETTGPRFVETPAKPGPKLRPKPIDPTDLAAYIEERWRLLRLDKAHRTVDVAVGLRFDVFNRDGFRCRYCGRSADDGVVLEVDHVVARAAGGWDALDNLVAACWDCNRGKSDKALDRRADTFH